MGGKEQQEVNEFKYLVYVFRCNNTTGVHFEELVRKPIEYLK